MDSPSTWQQTMFADIGDFLSSNNLDPTPDHYDLVYQYRSSVNARLTDAVRGEIEKSGALSSEAAERIFVECAGPVTADALAQYTARIGVQMDGLSRIVDQTGRDASKFCEDLESTALGERETLLRLSAEMVARTRVAEAQLRQTSAELTNLRETLAEAQHDADTDPLTELPNRRAFKRELETAIEENRRKKKPLSLAFCDLDQFKRINDEYGHEAGDRVLRYVARKLRNDFSKIGVIGRFGGEEFVVMFPNHNLKAAHAAIDNCRQELAARHLYTASDKSSLGSVTFSAGVTTMIEGDGSAELLRRADEALYRGKAAGRNCVMLG
jgi:diguanylate cyclase